jgi:hypothetical protein
MMPVPGDTMTTADEIADELAKLTLQQQQSVLRYARALSAPLPPGAKLKVILSVTGGILPDDLKQMQDAIEQHCEQVNVHGW